MKEQHILLEEIEKLRIDLKIACDIIYMNALTPIFSGDLFSSEYISEFLDQMAFDYGIKS